MLRRLAQPVNRALRRVPTWPVWILAFVPAVWLTWLLLTGGLGVDPVKAYERELGLISLQFLVAGLCVTPLMRFVGLNLIRFRRLLGVAGFVYALLHLLVWLVLDKQLWWAELGRDLVKRPYILVGMASFVLLLPLAWTSTDRALRRMGAAAWRRLHLLTYPAVLLGAGHFLLLSRTWAAEPILYLLAALGLVGLRALWRRGAPAPGTHLAAT